MEELENDLILFDGLMQIMRKPVHLERIKFINLGLRYVFIYL